MGITPDIRFGACYAIFTDMGYLHLPATTYEHGVLPAYPCYWHGSPGWDSSKHNLFMIEHPNNDGGYSLQGMEDFLEVNPWCFLIFGNEPDQYTTAGDQLHPQAYAEWLIDPCISVLQRDYDFTAVVGAISQDPRVGANIQPPEGHQAVNWVRRTDNPWPENSMEAYMWDVLRYFRESYGYELSNFIQYRNYHLYGDFNGVVSQDVQLIFDLIARWNAFYTADPNIESRGYDYQFGTNWSTKPIIVTETSYNPDYTVSDADRQEFVAQLFARLRRSETDLIKAWCYFAATRDSGRTLLDTNHNLTPQGKEYAAMANYFVQHYVSSTGSMYGNNDVFKFTIYANGGMIIKVTYSIWFPNWGSLGGGYLVVGLKANSNSGGTITATILHEDHLDTSSPRKLTVQTSGPDVIFQAQTDTTNGGQGSGYHVKAEIEAMGMGDNGDTEYAITFTALK